MLFFLENVANFIYLLSVGIGVIVASHFDKFDITNGKCRGEHWNDAINVHTC